MIPWIGRSSLNWLVGELYNCAFMAARNRNSEMSDVAPRTSEKENHANVRPFTRTLRVTNPVRQSRASSRKRVLRGESTAKRRERVLMLCG